MTKCTKCKQKIEGKTCYWKTKVVCSDCFYKLKDKPTKKFQNIAEIRKHYLKWLKSPEIKRKHKFELLQKSLGGKE